MTIVYDFTFTFTNLFALSFPVIGFISTSITHITAILTDSITGLTKIAPSFITTYARFAVADRRVCALD